MFSLMGFRYVELAMDLILSDLLITLCYVEFLYCFHALYMLGSCLVSYRVLYMLVSCFVFVVFLIGFWVLENKLSYDAF